MSRNHRILRLVIRGSIYIYLGVISILGLRKIRDSFDAQKTLILTGTFHSNNWLQSHIIPISRSNYCKKIYLVTTADLTYPEAENISIIVPPQNLIKIVGKVPARIIYFVFISVRLKPDYVGGFHLLFNALVAQFTAKLTRSKSLYFCVGGPAEVLGGGINSENRLLGRFEEPDLKLERTLIQVVKGFNQIITMGTSAKQYFKDNGVRTDIEVISGGIDNSKFKIEKKEKRFDFIFVGRLAQIKRIDIIIDALSYAKSIGKQFTLAIVGDGEKKSELQKQVTKLNLNSDITFLGKRDDIESCYAESKVFILSSDSEGLSLALMEAMMSGLPAIVSDVGDLSDIVEDQKNGFLIKSRDPKEFSKKMIEALESKTKYNDLSECAFLSAEKFSVQNTIIRWDGVLK